MLGAFNVGTTLKPSKEARMGPLSPRLAAFICLILTIAVLSMMGQRKPHAESATIASPRTLWSSRRPSQRTDWLVWQTTLAAEAAAWSPTNDGQGSLLLLGDSITEAWRGTSYGKPARRADGAPFVFDQVLRARWPSSLVLAISGDQVRHMPVKQSHTIPPPHVFNLLCRRSTFCGGWSMARSRRSSRLVRG